jgi:uncharacterized protein YjbI with pentapeptide repeats
MTTFQFWTLHARLAARCALLTCAISAGCAADIDEGTELDGDEQVSSTQEALSGCPGGGYQGQNLQGRDFSGRYMPSSNFCGANLQGAILSDAYLRYSTFYGATANGASFNNADIRSCDFYGATANHADFRDAACSGAAFTARR